MIRALSAAALSIALASSATFAQDGPLRRAGRALDNTGKNIRARVETEVVRGQISAQEREVLGRVARRIEWDKPLATSTIQIEAQAGGLITLRGSVVDQSARLRAVDLVQNTIGVTTVVDELAIAKDVRVIEAPVAPTSRVIETRTAAPVVEVTRPVVVPPGSTVIVKP